MKTVVCKYLYSDSTYGWKGGLPGFSIYYTSADNVVFPMDHSILLNSMLTPMITVQQETSRLLGKPYTECNNQTGYDEMLCLNKDTN